jgi:DNA end-binding protein Ku
MATHALGSATVTFGLVSIPIKLYALSETKNEIHFNLLHDKCGTRLKQQYICPKDEEVVPFNHRIKGFEFAKNQYVTFTPKELKELEAEASYSVDIDAFVPLASVDPIYFNRAYYLGPDKGGEKAYSLLREALVKTKHAAIARYAARGKDYLVLIRPKDEHLIMQQMHFADEIRSAAEIPAGKKLASNQELPLAIQLIEQRQRSGFNPQDYQNDTRNRLHEIIEKKAKGKEVVIAPQKESKAQVIDLMQALKDSLKQKTKKPKKVQSGRSR